MTDNDLTGKIMMVTGGTHGIGLATARELAHRGAAVLIVGHRPERDHDVVGRVIQETSNSLIHYYHANLAVQADVHRLAEEIRAQEPRLDVLINNVGGYFMKRQVTPDGYERTFALNHLNTFLLTWLLLDTLEANAPARIVNVASAAHEGAELDFDDLQTERNYTGYSAYRRSKLAMIMMTYALARRLEGTGVTVNAVHPGFVDTGLWRRLPRLLGVIARPIISIIAKSPDEGAETVVYVAASPEIESVSGSYWADQHREKSSPASHDEAAQERLWKLTLDMVGVEEKG